MRAGTTQFGSFVEQIPLFGQCYLKFLEITRGAQSQSRTISGSFDCSHDSPFDLIICASILECPYILGKLRLTFPSMIEWCLMGVVSGLESIPCGPYVILRGINYLLHFYVSLKTDWCHLNEIEYLYNSQIRDWIFDPLETKTHFV